MVNVVELLLAVGLFVVFLRIVEAGYRAGQRRRGNGQAAIDDHLTTVQGGLLGLLALLLGFAFSGAMSRFIERQDIIAQEAATVLHAHRNVELATEPGRGLIRAALERYADKRLEVFEASMRGSLSEDDQQAMGQSLEAAWQAAAAYTDANRLSLVVNPINDLRKLETLREAAMHRHIPWLVMALLMACAAAALYSVGYTQGAVGRRGHVSVRTLGFLVAATIWTTVDLDYPRRGLVQVSDRPLREAREKMASGLTP